MAGVHQEPLISYIAFANELCSGPPFLHSEARGCPEPRASSRARRWAPLEPTLPCRIVAHDPLPA